MLQIRDPGKENKWSLPRPPPFTSRASKLFNEKDLVLGVTLSGKIFVETTLIVRDQSRVRRELWGLGICNLEERKGHKTTPRT